MYIRLLVLGIQLKQTDIWSLCGDVTSYLLQQTGYDSSVLLVLLDTLSEMKQELFGRETLASQDRNHLLLSNQVALAVRSCLLDISNILFFKRSLLHVRMSRRRRDRSCLLDVSCILFFKRSLLYVRMTRRRRDRSGHGFLGWFDPLWSQNRSLLLLWQWLALFQAC